MLNNSVKWLRYVVIVFGHSVKWKSVWVKPGPHGSFLGVVRARYFTAQMFYLSPSQHCQNTLKKCTHTCVIFYTDIRRYLSVVACDCWVSVSTSVDELFRFLLHRMLSSVRHCHISVRCWIHSVANEVQHGHAEVSSATEANCRALVDITAHGKHAFTTRSTRWHSPCSWRHWFSTSRC